MDKPVKNMLPKRYFGIHMAPGLAEYHEGTEPFRILLNESTIKKMDATFEGRPVYVEHKEDVDLNRVREEADGYVVKSFYNENDGKHWVEFLVVSKKGQDAINNGWRLSNAYHPKTFGPGGVHHGMDYQKEVTDGEYEHLAIVPNPRYDESIVFTPEQFKAYNSEKELERKRLTNSKEGASVLNFFKRSKVENSLDIENTLVVLPESKKEISISELVAAFDKIENMHGYANMDHMVKVGEEEMSVKNLISKHMKMCGEMDEMKKNADLDGGEKQEEKDKKDADKTENADLDGGEKQEEKDKKKADKTENDDDMGEGQGIDDPANSKKKNAKDDAIFNDLKNAHLNPNFSSVLVVDKAELGKQRYGAIEKD